MKLGNVRVLRGPSLWALIPVIEVELEVREDEAPALRDNVQKVFAGFPAPSGTVTALSSNAIESFADLWASLVLALQSTAWKPVAFRRIERLTPGSVHIAVEYQDESLAKAAVNAALKLAEASGANVDGVREAAGQLKGVVQNDCLADAETAVIEAAGARGIPWRRLTQSGAIQLGHGSRQRLVSRNSFAAASPAPVPADLLDGLAYSIALPMVTADTPAAPGAKPYRALVAGGRFIGLVRSNPGGAADDVTGQASPALVSRCLEAVRGLELNVAVFDFHLVDPALPPDKQDERSDKPSGILVRILPGLDDSTSFATPEILKRFGEALVEHSFPNGETGRIPIGTITGVNGKTTTTRLLAKFMGSLGHRVGMTCSDGISVAERIIDHDDCSGPRSARRCLRNPTVDAGVFEVARGGILREGLGFEQSDVAIVTNIADGDHLGISWVNTPKDLARIKQVTVDAVGPHGHAVLHAEDPLTVAMAPRCRGQVIYFTRKPDHPVVAEHRAKGGMALIERDGQIVIAEGTNETVVMRSADIPLTRGGRLAFQVENVLAAVAAARSLGVPLPNIRDCLRAFDSDVKTCPGRFNVLEHNGTTIILDFGHNPSAVTALVQAVEQFPATKRHVVYSADGDRSDAQIRQQTANLGGAFDRVVLYEEPGRFRGRQAGELYTLLKEGLAGCTRVKDVEQVDGEINAIRHALGTVRSGELLLIQVDAVSVDLDFVCQHLNNQA